MNPSADNWVAAPSITESPSASFGIGTGGNVVVVVVSTTGGGATAEPVASVAVTDVSTG